MFFILSSAVAFGQVESYQTTIYTSEELASEIQTVVDDSKSRGLGGDMFAAGTNALLGIGTGYISSAVDLGVNFKGRPGSVCETVSVVHMALAHKPYVNLA